MKVQHGLISLIAQNKIKARQKAEEFLKSYQKQRIRVLAVEGKEEETYNIYEIEVQYYDEYEDFGIFPSTDFVQIETEEEKQLKLIQAKMDVKDIL